LPPSGHSSSSSKFHSSSEKLSIFDIKTSNDSYHSEIIFSTDQVSRIFIASLFNERTLGDVIFEVCSAQGNVGLTTGITSINMEPIGKIMLIINMWIGRLEIIPIIVLIKSMFGIRRNIL